MAELAPAAMGPEIAARGFLDRESMKIRHQMINYPVNSATDDQGVTRAAAIRLSVTSTDLWHETIGVAG
ncbi:hypothetical protein ACFZC6_34755 [Streptomyces ossamyceticus]|uniref:Uncharacterized protein n=1 Tax=Streptomyces ossamyceticus TaxID=249581 RepID=A0ABV2UY52_9ACTN